MWSLALVMKLIYFLRKKRGFPTINMEYMLEMLGGGLICKIPIDPGSDGTQCPVPWVAINELYGRYRNGIEWHC
ncbi:hypothetical protein GDO78_002919 [Eleutherodactylus coqui]|uniref:Uncharacterized protein n=1 Tax=Eleutherodactylus coqui TaxID=57060 RepID=A0A8J6K1I6_ELECQ|nr:hypothetical protein GDO78_002919 [Eleutherodactylus coqui]